MKDLKHLFYFESLLEDANNELIRKAMNEDHKLAIGYTCFHMPEVLLNVGNCFSTRIRAPKTGSMDIATYYMSNYTCEYCRAILERAIEGGYNFLSGIAAVDACFQMNRCVENIEIQKLIDNPKFFVSHVDVPYKADDDAIAHYVTQLRHKVLDVLTKNYGVDTSDKALIEAVKMHNEVCDIITEIAKFRKEDNPRITGYEFHIINLVSYVCPKYLIVDKLRETLEELKTREPNETKQFRAKVVVVGSEVDDPDLTKLIEESGALVVGDRYCFGSLPGRQAIVLHKGIDVLTDICSQYLKESQCPRFMEKERIKDRRDKAFDLVQENNAEGVVYEQMKFCDYWGYERALASYVMSNEYNVPTLSIDRPYNSRSSGQLRTRIQAFVESLEIKAIQKNNKAKEVK